jgi:hypothetical protein
MASTPSSSGAAGADERLFNELEQRYVTLRAEADLLVVDRDMIKCKIALYHPHSNLALTLIYLSILVFPPSCIPPAKLASVQAAHHTAEAVADKLRAEAAEKDTQLRSVRSCITIINQRLCDISLIYLFIALVLAAGGGSSRVRGCPGGAAGGPEAQDGGERSVGGPSFVFYYVLFTS